MAIIRGRQLGLDMPTLAKQFKTSKSVIWATLNTPQRSKATGRPLKTSSGDDRIIQWDKVLWSYESKYLMIGTEGITHVRRPVDKRYDPKYQVKSVKHGGGNVMICLKNKTAKKLYREVRATQGRMDQDPISDPDELDRVHAKRCEAVIKAKGMVTKY
uniref:Uncharacterized protein n=1 Tax=Caenorhabditis japonica TaxID=281687 RepID=A0A8R1IDB3_CAEJA